MPTIRKVRAHTLVLMLLTVFGVNAQAANCPQRLSGGVPLTGEEIYTILPGLKSVPPVQIAQAIYYYGQQREADRMAYPWVFREYFRGIDRGDSHSLGLLRLGALVVPLGGTDHLALPENPFEIIARFELGLKDMNLPPEHIRRPGIFLVRKIGDRIEKVLFRPSIDEWPGDGWAFELRGYQVPFWKWYWMSHHYKAIPIFITDVFHELGHLTDELMSPVIMKENSIFSSRLYGRIAEGLRVKSDQSRFNILGSSADAFDEKRSSVLSETLTVADIKRADAIQQLLSDYHPKERFESTGPANKKIENLSSDELSKRVKNFLTHAPDLIVRAGAGIKVISSLWSMDQGIAGTVSRLNAILNLGKERSGPLNTSAIDSEFFSDTLPQMLRLLETLVAIRFNGEMGFTTRFLEERKQIILKVTDPQIERRRQENAEKYIRILLARLETAFGSARANQITVDDIYTESRNQEPDLRTKTFRYFKSFMPSDRATYQAFRLWREKSR